MDKNIIKYSDDTRKSALKRYYEKYLLDVRGLKMSSVKHYFDALNNISKRLKRYNLVKTDIYEIDNVDELARIRDILYTDVEFLQQDERGRRMYSAGLNNYYKFACGDEFEKVKDRIVLLDMPIALGQKKEKNKEVWNRSGILRTQTLMIADYKCEININHHSFIAEANNKPYMESHHAIPMAKQGMLSTSLDVYANLVCLCPVCHRRIHYGIKNERLQLIDQIYETRRERLVNSGIRLSKDEFETLAL